MRTMTLLTLKRLLTAAILFVFIAVPMVGAVILWRDSPLFSKEKLQNALVSLKNEPQSVAVKYASLFPWLDDYQEKTSDSTLAFKAAKIAPNGNGILSGVAQPGNNIYLKDQEIKVASAKSDPEGLWVAIVENPLADKTKVYNLYAQTPDGQVETQSKQQLEIEIPENKLEGARIKILEKGREPIVLAQNLVIPPALVSGAQATATSDDKKSGDGDIVISSVDYSTSDDGTGTVRISGKAKKNAPLTIFMNEDEVGKTTADRDGNWTLSEAYEIKPGSQNQVRVEQRDKNNKVISKGSHVYQDKEPAAKGEAVVAAAPAEDDKNAKTKEKTFWDKMMGMFSSDPEESADDKKANQQAQADKQPGGNTQNAESGQASGLSSAINNKEAPKQKGQDDATKQLELADNKSDLSTGPTSANKVSGGTKSITNNKEKSPFVKDQAANKNGSADNQVGDTRATKKKRKSSKQRNARAGSKKAVRKRKSRTARANNRLKKRRASRKASRLRKYRARNFKRSKYRARKTRRARRARRRASRTRNSGIRKRRHAKKTSSARRSARYRRRIAAQRSRSAAAARKRRGKRRFLSRRAKRMAAYRRKRNSRNLRRYAQRRRDKKKFLRTKRRANRSRRRIAAIRRKRSIRIRRGDTLWDLARIKYGSGRKYRKIYRANKKRLRNPNRLSPNQRLFLPA